MAEPVRAVHGTFGRAALLQMTAPLVAHAHPQAHLLFNLGDAAATFDVAGRRLPLAAVSGVAVNGWEPHEYPHDAAAGRGQPLVLAIYLEPDWLAGVAGRPSRFRDGRVAMRPAVVRLCEHLRTELRWAGPRSPALVEEMAAELTVPLVESAPETDGGVIDFRVRRAIEHMRRHLGDRLDAGSLARACGVSRPHFFELFKQATGVSPFLYWDALRMERALDGLAGTSFPIGELAGELGFSEQANFTRFFRAHQGVAPREYRRATRPTLG
jgi:AraC-like DNA-binding protein